jgi:predicted dehydrogenase
MTKVDRRDFLLGTVAAVGATALPPAASAAPVVQTTTSKRRVIGANDRVRVGVIGTGRQGTGDMRGHQRLEDVEIAAVCDVFATNLNKAGELAAGAARHADFRKVLDDPSIDAVVIATPDHWHALITVMACQAGKDFYVEKPTSVAIAEGRAMVQAARKYQRIVQVGTQQRSQPHFQKAAELVRSGAIGDVTLVRCWNVGNAPPQGIGNPPDGAPPEGLDWDMWLGPAKKVPFNPNRFGVVPDAWSHFRWFWDYAGGMMTDWGVHLIDIVHLAMNVEAPLSVSTIGGKFHLTDNRETPDTIVATFQYPDFVMTYENRVCNSQPMNGRFYGIEFHGTTATRFVDRERFEVRPEPAPSNRPQDAVRPETKTEAAAADGSFPSHQRNFIDCVKSRKAPICDIEIGHRSSSTAILGNMALRSGQTVVWDAKTERVTNANVKAQGLVARAYRAPWKLVV